ATPDGTAEAPDHLRMRLVTQPRQSPIVVATFLGKPAPGAVVKVFPEDGNPIELKKDDQGRLENIKTAGERPGFLAKWSEKAPGTLDGKTYDEVRYYATLTVGPDITVRNTAKTDPPPAFPFATLPEAINSFESAVLGD